MNNVLKLYLAGQIRTFRKAAGLTQEELGARIDRTGEAISNIERGASLPGVETLVAIGEVLDKPVQEFLPSRPSRKGVSANRLRMESEAMALLQALSDKELGIAIAQVKALGEG